MDAILRPQPLVEMLSDECIVVQMRVGSVDTIDLGGLAGAERLVAVQAPRASK